MFHFTSRHRVLLIFATQPGEVVQCFAASVLLLDIAFIQLYGDWAFLCVFSVKIRVFFGGEFGNLLVLGSETWLDERHLHSLKMLESLGHCELRDSHEEMHCKSCSHTWIF